MIRYEQRQEEAGNGETTSDDNIIMNSWRDDDESELEKQICEIYTLTCMEELAQEELRREVIRVPVINDRVSHKFSVHTQVVWCV